MASLSSFSKGLGLSMSELASWLGLSRSAFTQISRTTRKHRSPRLLLLSQMRTEWEKGFASEDLSQPIRDFEPLRKIRQLESEKEYFRLLQKKTDREGLVENLHRVLAWCRRVMTLPEVKGLPGLSPKLQKFSETTRQKLMDLEPWEAQYLELEIKQAEEKILFFKSLENQ